MRSRLAPGRRAGAGALYTTLDRLEDKGMVAARLGDPTPLRGGRAKRYFKVTSKGLEAVTRRSAHTGAC